MKFASNPGVQSRYWILGPWKDSLWLIGPPLWIGLLAWFYKDLSVVGLWGGTLLAIGATGHHLPGFIRAYTNPEFLKRYKTRLAIAPLLFLTVCLGFALFNLHGLEVILLLWGAWHGAMQVHGFMRIYDSRMGHMAPLTARLDQAMCLAWFGAGLLYSEAKLHLLGLTLHRAHSSLPPELVISLRGIWILFTACITVAFAANTLFRLRQGKGPHPLKFVVMVFSFAFWWVCMVALSTPLLGVLLFEIYHDVQYNVFVWGFQRHRLSHGKAIGFWEKFLFQPSLWRTGIYCLLLLAYGTIGALADYGAFSAPGDSQAGSNGVFFSHLFMASAFLHFYLDGFIWRVRDPEFRKELGISEKWEGNVSFPLPKLSPWGQIKWAIFLIPVLLLILFGTIHPKKPDLELYRNLAPLLPTTWHIHYILGSLEKEAGNPGAAATSLEKAIGLKPDLELDPLLLAELYKNAGAWDRAIDHYRQRLEHHPKDIKTRYDLGLLLRDRGRLTEAVPELRKVADGFPEHAGVNYSAGLALLMEHNAEAAVAYLQKTVTSDPRHKQGWYQLGAAWESLKQWAEARKCYKTALEMDSNFSIGAIARDRMDSLLTFRAK